jgi:hypothetical protein
MLGAFLGKLGLSYKAIQWITEKGANDANFLGWDTAKNFGIEVVNSEYLPHPVQQPRVTQTTSTGSAPVTTVNIPNGAQPVPIEKTASPSSPDAVHTPAQRYMNTKKVLGLWTVEDLHLRKEPNPSANDVLRGSPPNDDIPSGTMVRLHTDQCVTWSDGERSALWCKVDYKEYTGWVNSHYLSEVAPDSGEEQIRYS